MLEGILSASAKEVLGREATGNVDLVVTQSIGVNWPLGTATQRIAKDRNADVAELGRTPNATSRPSWSHGCRYWTGCADWHTRVTTEDADSMNELIGDLMQSWGGTGSNYPVVAIRTLEEWKADANLAKLERI